MIRTITLIFAFALVLIGLILGGQRQEGVLVLVVEEGRSGYFVRQLDDPQPIYPIAPQNAAFMGWYGHYSLWYDLPRGVLVRVDGRSGRHTDFYTLSDPTLMAFNFSPSPDGRLLFDATAGVLIDPAAASISPAGDPISRRSPPFLTQNLRWVKGHVLYVDVGGNLRVVSPDTNSIVLQASIIGLYDVPNSGHWLYFTVAEDPNTTPHLERIDIISGRREVLFEGYIRGIARAGADLFTIAIDGSAPAALYRIDLLGQNPPQVVSDATFQFLHGTPDEQWLILIGTMRELYSYQVAENRLYTLTDSLANTSTIEFISDERLQYDILRRDGDIQRVQSNLDGRQRQVLNSDTQSQDEPEIIATSGQYFYVAVGYELYRVHEIGWRDFVSVGRLFPSPDAEHIAILNPDGLEMLDTASGDLRLIATDISSKDYLTLWWTENGIVLLHRNDMRIFMQPDGSQRRRVPALFPAMGDSASAKPDPAASDPLYIPRLHVGMLWLLALLLGGGGVLVGAQTAPKSRLF